MTEWRFIGSGPCRASHNMAVDEAIATVVRRGEAPPTLRIYGWDRPSISLGSFQKASDVNRDFCSANNIPIVRRPTGGRAIFHDDELTYSFSSALNGIFSNGLLDSYHLLSAALKTALDAVGLSSTMKLERESARNLTRSPLCFGCTSYGELAVKGSKIVGSAQKRWKDGLLQQGSIPYAVNGDKIKSIFALDPSAGLGSSIGLRELLTNLEPEKLVEAICMAFEDAFRIKLIPSLLSREEYLLARDLEERKYLSHEWTFQR